MRFNVVISRNVLKGIMKVSHTYTDRTAEEVKALFKDNADHRIGQYGDYIGEHRWASDTRLEGAGRGVKATAYVDGQTIVVGGSSLRSSSSAVRFSRWLRASLRMGERWPLAIQPSERIWLASRGSSGTSISGGVKGTEKITRQPEPGADSSVKPPPQRMARSRMLISP